MVYGYLWRVIIHEFSIKFVNAPYIAHSIDDVNTLIKLAIANFLSFYNLLRFKIFDLK